jgi:hypothetical protein
MLENDPHWKNMLGHITQGWGYRGCEYVRADREASRAGMEEVISEIQVFVYKTSLMMSP